MKPKKWFYVMAEGPAKEPTMLSFSHHIVYGHDQHEAYNAGFEQFKQEPKNEGNIFLNDYVIQISGAV